MSHTFYEGYEKRNRKGRCVLLQISKEINKLKEENCQIIHEIYYKNNNIFGSDPISECVLNQKQDSLGWVGPSNRKLLHLVLKSTIHNVPGTHS